MKRTPISNLSGVSAKPGAMRYMAQGMASSAMAVKAINVKSRTESASSAKRRAAVLPSPSSALAKSGTKAELNAPSANNLRKRLGNLNATKNASAIGPVPSAPAIRMSRMKPSTRLTSVMPPTVIADLTRFIYRSQSQAPTVSRFWGLAFFIGLSNASRS